MTYAAYEKAGDAFFMNLSNGNLIDHLFNTADHMSNEFNLFCYEATTHHPILFCAEALKAQFEVYNIQWVDPPNDIKLNSDARATRKWLQELRANFILFKHGPEMLQSVVC